jgi:glycosyltransferase involved in cell wall biosynthesis
MSNKRVLILFPDEWLSHSPTLLNLVENLKEYCDVRLLAVDDGVFRNSALRDPSFTFIKVNKTLAVLFLRRVRFLYTLIKGLLILKELRKLAKDRVPDIVIGVDSIGLWTAQKVFGSAHFLSLEISRDLFFKSCKRDRILSLAIQSEERAAFLFQDRIEKTFLLPNAPVLPETFPALLTEKKFNARLIFLGIISPSHGIYACLEAMEKLASKGATLTVKGVLYKKRVQSTIMKRYQRLFGQETVFLDQNYLNQEEILPFLSQFSIGFCLYDFERLSPKDFNYVSSPSGKLFNYYAAGVPIIGTDVLGLRSVKEFRAGVLLSEHTPEAIGQAYEEISQNFEFYRKNCLEAARHFDFRRAMKPYSDFLLSQVS